MTDKDNTYYDASNELHVENNDPDIIENINDILIRQTFVMWIKKDYKVPEDIIRKINDGTIDYHNIEFREKGVTINNKIYKIKIISYMKILYYHIQKAILDLFWSW